ncbi:hypothetical protein RHSIM_Rhsim04G0177600 [Rhododendron simsii]|uniref:Glutathione S-transferase n=1 Tax=Rhododendron simsii TaxID=118357 RepID=A0A834H4B3_RHOSS|nr:hypothetical protein RHSIM_Rhsim04G0177600 [Rhododendron simsii]
MHLKEAVESLEKIEQELITGKCKFFGGETIGYLDIALGVISYWLPVWEEIGSMTIVDPIQFPATAGWMENFRNHPMVKDKLPPRDKMFWMNVGRALWTVGEDKEMYLEQAVESLEKIEQELLKRKSKFFGGETIGYLDIALEWISYWLPVFGGSWVHNDHRPNPIPSHRWLDREFQPPPYGQGQVTAER